MTIHYLKTWPEYFQAAKDGRKPFEVRKADRPYAVGDTLVLAEWDDKNGRSTGESVEVEVTYILSGGRFGISEDYCVMGIRPLKAKAVVISQRLAVRIARELGALAHAHETRGYKRDALELREIISHLQQNKEAKKR